ncbi:MAG TPA: hypothetical protein VG538_00210 [Vicinamibacterales bacterium]|nr:hypothetical protein [Vicinamibacterales bacterium]
MRLARNVGVLIVAVVYLHLHPATIVADTGYCDIDCNPTRSCDYACMYGGSFTTCGEYNGGLGSGMCSGSNPWCSYTIVYSTMNRHGYDGLSEECYGILGWIHTPPFSNFGVESPHGSRQDSFQFAGWVPDDGKLQWNACTTDSPYTPPSSIYYNYDNYTNQFSPTEYTYASNIWNVPGTCVSQLNGGVYTELSTYAEVWDLDNNWPDSKIGRITFPDTNIIVSCDASSDTCSGQSAVVLPSEDLYDLTGSLHLSLYAYGYLGQ